MKLLDCFSSSGTEKEHEKNMEVAENEVQLHGHRTTNFGRTSPDSICRISNKILVNQLRFHTLQCWTSVGPTWPLSTQPDRLSWLSTKPHHDLSNRQIKLSLPNRPMKSSVRSRAHRKGPKLSPHLVWICSVNPTVRNQRYPGLRGVPKIRTQSGPSKKVLRIGLCGIKLGHPCGLNCV